MANQPTQMFTFGTGREYRLRDVFVAAWRGYWRSVWWIVPAVLSVFLLSGFAWLVVRLAAKALLAPLDGHWPWLESLLRPGAVSNLTGFVEVLLLGIVGTVGTGLLMWIAVRAWDWRDASVRDRWILLSPRWLWRLVVFATILAVSFTVPNWISFFLLFHDVQIISPTVDWWVLCGVLVLWSVLVLTLVMLVVPALASRRPPSLRAVIALQFRIVCDRPGWMLAVATASMVLLHVTFVTSLIGLPPAFNPFAIIWFGTQDSRSIELFQDAYGNWWFLWGFGVYLVRVLFVSWRPFLVAALFRSISGLSLEWPRRTRQVERSHPGGSDC